MLKREDYKAIKRMDRQQMDEYLKRVYMRGYDAALKKSVVSSATAKQDPEAAALSEEKAEDGE